ncbi:MAG TPA: cytochrome ubiquinol oxidase subunit I [Bryobacteraceae bacterium]|nr:cytochrome ubiquinol oxidase subunit I [Bryobacteraceae bacterium]
MNLDVVLLSRIQFALTIMFHYLFPPLTIGMGVVLVFLEGNFLRTRQPVYETAARFWTSLYAVTFAMGVATGIVMEFEFGTNWANYSRFVGDVFGSALAAEGIFAFFLESGFLALLIFGWEKVTPPVHFFATTMVSLGSMFSAVWIIVANSWQQTPAGHHIVTRTMNGVPYTRAETVDFWAVVLNPSTINRLFHTLIGAWVLGAFFIMSISAWYLLKNKHREFGERSFTGALVLATIASLLALLSGDSNAKMVAHEQPAKLAAFEGHFRTGPGDLTIFGVPDPEAGRMRINLAVPGGLGLLINGDPNLSVIGLDKVPKQYWPNVVICFWSFHIMVGLGMAFIGLTLFASFLRWRGTLFQQRWLLWVFVWAVIGPFIANELGWVSACAGRQPWIVHPRVIRDASGEPLLDAAGMIQYRLEEGLLTRRGVSESVRGEEVLASILTFGAIYSLLFFVWVYVLNDKIQKGPKPIEPATRTTTKGFLQATAGRTLHEGSLSEAKDEADPAAAPPRPGDQIAPETP